MSEVFLIERLAGAGIAVACVLAGLKFALARVPILAGGRNGRVLAVLEHVYLPGAASVHLVRAGPRLLVLGRSGGGGLVTLCELEPDADPHCR